VIGDGIYLPNMLMGMLRPLQQIGNFLTSQSAFKCHLKAIFNCIVLIMAVHGSVRFRLQKPTEPSNLNIEKFKPNRTENRFKPDRFSSVKFGFFVIKPRNPILSYMGFFFGLARILLFKSCKYGKAKPQKF